MKSPTLLLLSYFLWLPAGSLAWMPATTKLVLRPATSAATTTARRTFLAGASKNRVNEISDELEAMGEVNANPNKHVDDHDFTPGMDAYQESLDHKLRKEVHDLKSELHVKEATIADLRAKLERINQRLEEFRVGFMTTENELKLEKRERKKEWNSMRFLIKHFFGLIGFRIKHAYNKITKPRLRRLLKLKRAENKKKT